MRDRIYHTHSQYWLLATYVTIKVKRVLIFINQFSRTQWGHNYVGSEIYSVLGTFDSPRLEHNLFIYLFIRCLYYSPQGHLRAFHSIKSDRSWRHALIGTLIPFAKDSYLKWQRTTQPAADNPFSPAPSPLEPSHLSMEKCLCFERRWQWSDWAVCCLRLADRLLRSARSHSNVSNTRLGKNTDSAGCMACQHATQFAPDTRRTTYVLFCP